MLGGALALIAWIGAAELLGPCPCDASRLAELLIASARAAEAQPAAKTHRVGFVSPTGPGARDEAFVNGLRELGYVDGRDIRLVMRFADGRPERIAGIVDELVRFEVDVLVVGEAFAGQWLELLEEATPHLGHAAVLWSSSNPAARRFVDEIRKAARKLRVTVDVHHAATAAGVAPDLPREGR